MMVKAKYRMKSLTHDVLYRVVNVMCNDGVNRDRLQVFDSHRLEWVYSNKDIGSKFFQNQLERIS